MAVVAAEDTRHFATLARHHGIPRARSAITTTTSRPARASCSSACAAGEDVALVSDAGTPLVSDPGYRLVRAAIEAGIAITSLPGPSAVTTALAASGLPPHPFRFLGFLPRTAAARRSALAAVAADAATLVAFESPRRLAEAMRDALATLGDRPACLARNLTKPHERYQRGPLSALIAELEAEGEVRGECTLVIGGAEARAAATDAAVADARLLISGGAAPRSVQELLVRRHGLTKREAYAVVLEMQERPVTAEIVERVRRSARYRDVDQALVRRLAEEELRRARNTDDAVKRVKRRLHQAVGAFRGAARQDALAASWHGDLDAADFRAACAARDADPRVDARAARRISTSSTRAIWRRTGVPARLLDLGCGLNPLALPWMGIGGAEVIGIDVDERPLATVRAFLELVGQPHEVAMDDLVASPPAVAADVTLLLKLVTTLDRQDPRAAASLLRSLRSPYAVVSFTTRSLGGRASGMERTYRDRLERLVVDAGRVRDMAETSVPNELVFILEMEGPGGG